MQKYIDNKNKEVYNIDFDGTLTMGEYTDDPLPVLNIIDKVNTIHNQGHVIIIWTARQWSFAIKLVSWLIKWDVPFHGIMMGKGGSDYYVDDKMLSIEQFGKI